MTSHKAGPTKRKVITPSRRTVRFIVPSPKNDGRGIECESTLEHDFQLLTEFSRGVAEVHEQQRWEILADDGSFVTFVDFKVILQSGEIEYHEVKPLNKRLDPEVNKRLEASREHLKKEGYPFFVASEDTIRRSQQLLNNLTLLRRFKQGDANYVRSLHQDIPRSLSTVKELVRVVGNNSKAVAMIAWQLVHCDLTAKLNDDIAVRHMEDGDHAFLYR